jgi:hypothetical protein
MSAYPHDWLNGALLIDNDSGDTLLFSYPEMVRDLILEFVPGD